jgi:hypothetical protein
MPAGLSRADIAPIVVEHAPDGTPLYAPRGLLPAEVDGSAVQCHLCGRWYRDLGSSQLRFAHGLTAADYRVLVGLRPRHPLQAPTLSAKRSDLLRARIPSDERLRAGMTLGAVLARDGALQRRAEQARRERGVSLERETQLATGGARLGSARAAAFAARREQRARALGFAGLEVFYRRRYGEQAARLEELADELGCSGSAVRGDLRSYGWAQIEGDRTARAGAESLQKETPGP